MHRSDGLTVTMKHLGKAGNKGIYGNTGRGMKINGYPLNIGQNKKGMLTGDALGDILRARWFKQDENYGPKVPFMGIRP